MNPQIDSQKMEIIKDLSVKLWTLQDPKKIHLAWMLALRQRLAKADMKMTAESIQLSSLSSSLSSPSPSSSNKAIAIRKELESAWSSSFVVDEVIDNCFEGIMNQVLGTSKYINLKKDIVGVILFPIIWQMAVDYHLSGGIDEDEGNNNKNTEGHDHSDYGTGGRRSNHRRGYIHVTAADADGIRLRRVLPPSLIQHCNERILSLLCCADTKIWNLSHWSHLDQTENILSEMLVSHLKQISNHAYTKSLEYVQLQSKTLLQQAITPSVMTSELLPTTLQTYHRDSQIYFDQCVRGALSNTTVTTMKREYLASRLGDYTRRTCRTFLISTHFQQDILPSFLEDYRSRTTMRKTTTTTTITSHYDDNDDDGGRSSTSMKTRMTSPKKMSWFLLRRGRLDNEDEKQEGGGEIQCG